MGGSAERSDAIVTDANAPAAKVEVDAGRLRSAIEFVLAVVANSKGSRPPLSYPAKLDRFVKMGRVPNGSLNSIRKIIEADDSFRTGVGAAATDELVDEIGLLWLQRPSGWQERIAQSVALDIQASADAEVAAQLKASEKRRVGAERAAARAVAELVGRDQRIDAQGVEIAALRGELDVLQRELERTYASLREAQLDARHAKDREQAALQRLAAAQASLEQSSAARRPASAGRDGGVDVVGSRGANASTVDSGEADTDDGPGGGISGPIIDPDVIDELASTAAQLAAQLAALGTDTDDRRSARKHRGSEHGDRRENSVGHGQSGAHSVRRSLKMPPGVRSDSLEGGIFLLEAADRFFLDGYNVAKLAWPGRPLIAQRDRLIDAAERVAARHGTSITIVFDGANVVGAHADRRRGVRVVYSAADQLADDLIRDEVRRLRSDLSVTVVTNDRAVRDDVERMGANLMRSNLFLNIATST